MTDDDRAAEIVGRCREAIARGECVDLDDVVRAHPDLAETLRRQLAALDRIRRAFARGLPETPSLVGRRLGPYRVEAALGTGGMGSVYLAVGDDAAQRVAIKVVHAHLLAREGFLRRFLREAEIGRRVRHANVVATLDADACDVDGRPAHFLVMEYVEGRNLRALLQDLGRVPEELCRHVGREVARALVAIHAAGAVHRDLKPDNVIVTPDHAVKVMDLGVARVADESARISQSGAFVGSVRYAAPEQFQGGDDVDGRADLYALGLTLYELATGRHPFESDEFRAVVRQQMSEVPPPAGDVNPQISPFFEELLARLLAKDRDERFASAQELLRVLEDVEESSWWRERSRDLRRETRRPLRRISIPRETALYGRDAELALLRSLYERASTGDGQVAVIVGEAGIGKSRLVDEFVLSLRAAGEDVDFLFGSYPPGGAATASGAFVTAYREHLGDEEAAIRAALPQTPLLAPAFAALLRGDAAPEGAEKLTKDSLQTVFVHATRSFAAKRTTIVLIDDLHFAPEEGRALFASIALAAPGHRILLLGGARPSLDAKWAAQIEGLDHATRLVVPRLTVKDLVYLLRDSLKSQHLAEELAGKIGVKSDGNPFFVFEILRGLREGQFITKRSDGTWATTREIREIQVPSSVVELVQARVSDLGGEDRNVLEVAACVGFEFDPALVGDVLRVERIPLLQRLGRIEKTHRLVRSAGRRFVFDHHQVMEVLYAGLSEPLREEYHAAIGTALEARHVAASLEPQDLDGALCVDLAEHFLEGARGASALRYLDRALTHLERSWLNDAAARLAERALAPAGLLAGSARAEMLLRLADRLDLLGRRGPQQAATEEALALARGIADRRVESRATGKLGRIFATCSRFAEAREHFERSRALAQAIGESQSEADATAGLGHVAWALGQFTEARDHHQRQLALAREMGDRRGEAMATAGLASVFDALGRQAEAHEHNERCLALAREIGDRRSEARITGNMGTVFSSLGRFAEARQHDERFLALTQEIGDRHGESLATLTLGMDFGALGRPAEARECCERGLALAREIGERSHESHALAGLGELAGESGDVALAERCFADSLGIRRALGARATEADSLCSRGALFVRTRRYDEARSDLDAALALARELSLPSVELAAIARLATLPGGDRDAAVAALGALGDRAELRDVMEARLLLWEATRDRAHLVEAKRMLDDLVTHAPEDCRESMLENVRVNREIAAAAREHGLA